MSEQTARRGSGIPENRCGYTYPEDFDGGTRTVPDRQNCCARKPLPDTDRCAFHADPDDTERKAAGVAETASAGASLDGAVLSDELAATVYFDDVSLLRGADLSGADFTTVRISETDRNDPHADKRDLSGTRLDGANLSGANLNGADLSDAEAHGADLSEADLSFTDLSGSDLRGTDLSGATLANADLRQADLSEAALSKADLRRATLSGTDFTEAILRRVDLRETTIAGQQIERAELSEVIVSGDEVKDLPESLASGDDGPGERLRSIRARDGRSSDVCGYTSFADEHFWTGETPQRSTCVLPTVADADRCIWHVSPANTDQDKTITALSEHLLDLRDREDMPRGQLLDEARLGRMRVNGADFKDVDFRHLSLRGANLSGTVRSEKDLSGVLLSHSDLTGADLTNTNLSEANLGSADLSGADLRQSDLSEAYLQDSDLSGARLSPNMGSEGVDMSGANLINADLSGAELAFANLSGTTLNGADLPEAELPETYLSNASLSRTDLSGANLRKADLSETDLRDADLSGAELSDADLRETELDGARLRDADVTEGMLTSADCEEAEFIGAKLTRATLEAADVTGADFTRAFLFQTRFNGAQVDGKTRFCQEGSIGDTTTPNYCRYDTEAPPESALESIETDRAEIDSAEESAEVLESRYARSTYRRLEALAQENGFPDLQSEMFIRRQDARRDLLFQRGQRVKGTFALIQDKLFRYGESFSRIAGFSVGVVVIGWVMYASLGIVETASGEPITLRMVADDPALAIDTLLNSVSVFFSGSRVLSATGQLGEIVAVTQSTIGPILVALLIFVLGRRAAR